MDAYREQEARRTGARTVARRHPTHHARLLAAVLAVVGGLVLPSSASGAAPASTASVYERDFPDPFLLRVGDTYYGYATNGSSHVRTIRSPDLVRWSPVADAMPVLPDWTVPGHLWAPAVLPRAGSYVMYYTTRDAHTGLQCLGRAVAASPAGPFSDRSSGPFLCQPDRGGSIDPSPFVDADGTPYLIWKSEGIAGREPTRLWVQQLSDDATALVGAPTELLRQDQAWEFPIIEGPSMVRDGDRYYLFYAGGRWDTPGYAIGYG
ncbi:MAG: glycoside hydrolase family 43 protein, partial [Actinomycetota bacterium]|nr:glycoside hydrolase family 43 protein [Actinomycetota bacterium]